MMEEEVGIKVTRLRRRLSVESDDVKSPSTQSTPTKKRGGRLAAKPQLELIDENVPDAAPKRTRKSTIKDIEPVEEKAVTPSRRSTRIRSNTSIVSETPGDVVEDKGTPARRSTRIKSNTSIVAESVQSVNSPRAKRAARRTSQVGSDTETPVTPARQTRRTRKDSTSSVDKQIESNTGKKGSETSKIIVEESENNDKAESPKSVSPTLRKSPRFVGKNERKSLSLDNEIKENKPQSENGRNEATTDANKSIAETKAEQTKVITDLKTLDANNLSLASSNLINDLDKAPKKGKNVMNKSTTAVEEPQIKIKRNRTKSWTAISVEPSNENTFCSDSEASKKRNKTRNLSNISACGDGIMNISNNVSLNSSSLSEKKKKKRQERSVREGTEISEHEVSVFDKCENLNKSTDKGESKQNKKARDSLNLSNKMDASAIEKMLTQEPTGLIQTLVFIDDSDSNQGSTGKGNIDKDFDSGDQCVPVVDHHLGEDDSSKEIKNNLSFEPMDIDETIPENIAQTTFTDKEENISDRHDNKEPEVEKRKSILNNSQVNNNSINKSKRKSLTTNIVCDDSVSESNKSQSKTTRAEKIDDNVVEDNGSNKSKRKSTNAISEDTTDGIFNNSGRKSVNLDNEDTMDKKSKRKSSAPTVVIENNIDKDSNESSKEFSIVDNIIKDVSLNKSKRKSSIVSNDNATSDITNKSKRKSSLSASVAEVSLGIEKSPNANKENYNSVEKKSNKLKRNSSMSGMESQVLDKTENENKSTLVLSQLKDMSESEINVNNVPKDSKELNEQLSKSMNVPNAITEKDDKKNISLTYSTSTPLQQKSVKKLGMQINSSIIAPNSISKVDKKNTQNSFNKDTSILSQKHYSDSSEEEEELSEEDSSVEKSKMIDDEAEEASDNYESGDSRDDDEKEYEEQNEIVEKGETLDSEDENEYSDDSEYEKGSFVVSSDEEDNDLLSGSGDDLSSSVDELSMSAKSKNKYNERKIKEQKKASREMFEARHKINESDKSDKSSKQKSKKNNCQRLDSSSSDSKEEDTVQPKKNCRQRIDSSQDISMIQSDADKSICQKKKKVKRLSESVCEDNATNEEEITIHETAETDNADPLTLQNAIKEEPKTPQKDLNISTVAVTHIDEVEEVDVDENISIMKLNQTLSADPLQATIVENHGEDIEEAEDSISENEEITQNYESVLNNLNVSNSKKIKSLDTSLNLNKKTKHKSKEPLVDQLNLTQVKKSKKKTADASKEIKLDKSMTKKKSNKVDIQENLFSEGSSDSIDIKLLFPEDSNDSEMIESKIRNSSKKLIANEITQKKDIHETPEEFIPLKRTEGKTNILEKIDVAQRPKDESILNISNTKKNKLKSSQTEEAVIMSTKDDDNIRFFIDTTGTLDIHNTDTNTSITNSAKKNKQINNASLSNIEEAKIDDDSNDAPLEVSYCSEKNKSKQNLNIIQNNNEITENNAGTPNQSAKKKKKNRKSLNSSQNVTETSMIENAGGDAEKSINTSVVNSAEKKKKTSESQGEHETGNTVPAETIQNVSFGSAKKQKQKTISENPLDEENVNKDDKDVTNEVVISKKRKRKSSANQTIVEEIIDKDNVKLNSSKLSDELLLTKNQKKKRKISNNDDDDNRKVQDTDTNNLTQEHDMIAVKISKKKDEDVTKDLDTNELVKGNTKKNKKRKNRDDDNDDASKVSKVLKENSLDEVHVPRLPVNVIKQLGDKPKQVVETQKQKVISTTIFEVNESRKRGKKPSTYLEESVYLNDTSIEKNKKGSLKYPKTLPSLPSAVTSNSGFTTNFRVNVIPQHTQFVAQSSDISNFKNDYLNKKRIKKFGTFELYKRQRNIKISKF